jgi:hypothetical protein
MDDEDLDAELLVEGLWGKDRKHKTNEQAIAHLKKRLPLLQARRERVLKKPESDYRTEVLSGIERDIADTERRIKEQESLKKTHN